jgi:PHD/YefM family antitoxin component YafN of YafNO toxin-antitoxin module
MPKNPHEVLPTREARAQLPAMLEHFRKQGADADPVVIGARRKPEAVVLSYERYLQLAGGRERVREMLDRWDESGGGLSEEDAMKLATEEVRAYRRERRSGH